MNKGTLQITFLEIKQNLRSLWFWAYSLLFGGFVAIMFALGITESQIIGFVGLGRLMVTFMQVSMVILPIYILITTVRSVVGDRETNVMEYMLSLPISFSGYFWGKFISQRSVVDWEGSMDSIIYGFGDIVLFLLRTRVVKGQEKF